MSLALLIVIVAIVSLAIWLFLKWFDRRNSVKVFGPWNDDRELARKNPCLRLKFVACSHRL